MDLSSLFAFIALVIIIIAFIPYFRDIFRRQTKPHAYTWLVWLITQGTAAAALLYGGGGIFGSTTLVVSLVCVVSIFFLSFRYGTRNITRSDTFVLAAALFAIAVWWQLNNPLLAVIMVSVIDFAGYIPSFSRALNPRA